MSVTGRRRGAKSWFVEPYRQVKLGLIVIVVNFIFAALIFGVFGYYMWDVYATVAGYFQLSQAESSDALGKFAMPAMIGGALILLFIVTTLLISVRYTHQIYGPLVSIHRFIDDLLEGQVPTPLVLRKGDQLTELAQKLNQLAEKVQSS